jgi:tetratricopeptide (TPR) repeat protein
MRAYRILSLRGELPTLLRQRTLSLARECSEDLALAYPERRLELWRSLSPAERRLQLVELGRVERVYADRLRLGGRATAVFHRFLEFSRSLGDGVEAARMLRFLGDMEEQEGRGSEALDLWEEAFLAAKETGWPPLVVDFEGKLAVGYSRRGLHDQARALLEEAIGLARSFDGDLFQARMLGRLGTVDFREGNLDRARERYEGALDLALEVGRPDLIHSQLNNLGAVATRQGRFDDAYEYYSRALREGLPAPFDRPGESTSSHYYRGQTLAGLGTMYLLAGRPRRAYLHLSRALSQFRAIGELYEESVVLEKLADLDLGLDRPEEALQFATRAFRLKRSLRDDVGESRALVRLGRVALARGRSAEARRALERAHQRALRFHDQFTFITSLLYMGESFRAEGRWAEAKQNLRDCTNLARENGLPLQEALAKLSLARIYRIEGKEPLAENTLREAIGLIERLRRSNPPDSFLASILGEASSAYNEMIALLVEQGAAPATSLEFAERSRARTLLDILSGRELVHRDLPAEDPAWSPPEETSAPAGRLEGAVEVAALLPYPEDPLPPLRGPSLGVATWELEPEGPEPPEEAVPPSLSPEALSRVPGRGTALVEYACLEDRLVAWIVTGGEIHSLVIPVGRDEVRAAVDRVHEALALGPAFRDAHPAWEERNAIARDRLVSLADRILHPLLPYLEGAVEVVIVPDGPLHLVPYAALPLRPDGEEPLVSRHVVRIAPSIATLEKLLSRSPPKDPFEDVVSVGYGGPFRRTPISGGVPDSLPRAAQEARMVAGLALHGDLLTGADATEANVRAVLPPATLIHLASHAAVDREQPLLSYVALARTPGEDGLFTMQEVLESHLETALGRVLPGEGVLGLTQSFLASGATSVVSTLWSVSDEAAYEFMVTFYRSLRSAADSPARALQLAQLRHLAQHRRPGDPLAHPHFWAAWTVTGR